MKLYLVRIFPESPWLTPWQSDTLSGLLCWTCARIHGESVLKQGIIEPALNGDPPFVVSDAFPGDWLPVPAAVRLASWAAMDRKSIKRAQWIDRSAFARFQQGQPLQVTELRPDRGIHEYVQLRNTIGRTSNMTTMGGGLYPTTERVLGIDSQTQAFEYLTIYVRVQQQKKAFFSDLLKELAAWGFGADRSAGKGQFRLGSELEEMEEFDRVERPTASIVLSTFQPGPNDPTDGAWDAFTKYGKLGQDFGLENVFKRPLIMIRPGACFRNSALNPYLGRAVPMAQLLSPNAAAELRARETEIIHSAYGLAVPARISWGFPT